METKPASKPLVESLPRRPYHLLAPSLCEGSLAFDALFERSLPIDAERELEIGVGKGRFLIERATRFPRSWIVGLEIKPKLAFLVNERRKRLGLENARVFWADAKLALPRLGPDACLDRIFIHFPDPWWKKRHAKRRLMSEAFVLELARLLREGGELFIQSDVEERALAMKESLERASSGGLPLFSVELSSTRPNPYGAQSNRELHVEKEGLPIHRIFARRCPHPPPAFDQSLR
ncbi:MAG: tRNA (guanosine(46)-N7)-methyltransferase TrmB [Sandaracinaceae bacterium]|nr:tRNA (guanosine(46)-N7)-methyltransferase TrmB [Sandaracinaceae bacterium]